MALICREFGLTETIDDCRFVRFVDWFSCKLIRLSDRDSLVSSRQRPGAFMRPKERRETGQRDLFRARLDQIVALDHPLVKLARAIDWSFLEERFGAVYTDDPGRPPLPTRLMAAQVHA